MKKQVFLAGQILHGVDRFGQWRIHTMEGWTATPELKTNSEERQLADGDYDGDDNYRSRLVTINGSLSAINPAQAFLARERLTGLLRRPGLFQVTDLGMDRYATARRGRIQPGALNGRRLTFQMELRFIDPNKYGDAHDFTANIGTALDVFHRGNRDAAPDLTVTGAMPTGYRLILGGETIEVTQPITAGQTHTIDTRTGILRSNGAVVIGGLGKTELFRIQPGTAQKLTSAPRSTGTGTVRADVADTYI